MSYYFSKTVNYDFDTAVANITTALKTEGFGISTEIDMKTTFKEKLDVDIRKYKVLGACNPHFAYKAIQAEKNIGTMLPCNIIVQENEDKSVEVTAVDPVASTKAIENAEVQKIVAEVQEIMKRVIAVF